MKVVAIRSFGAEEVLVDDVWPEPQTKPGQVRVRIEAASFNPIDLYWRSGRIDDRLPAVLGRDFAGIVDAIGDDVDDLRVGDRVYGYQAGLASNGTYAEVTCLPALLVARRPVNWTAAQCAAMPVAGLTAYKAVREKAGVAPGEPLLVAGAAGGVGSAIVQLARLAGAGPILATAGSERSREFLIGLGLRPEWILDYRGVAPDALAQRVRTLNEGRGVRASFDTAGGDMKLLCFAATAADGHVVSIVEEPADFDLNLWDERTSPMSIKSLSFHFVELSARARSGDAGALGFYRQALDWLTAEANRGGLEPPAIEIAGALSAETARTAHRRLATRHPGAKLVMIAEKGR